MRTFLLFGVFILLARPCYCWGFFGHRQVNYYAIFLLPPEMLSLYKPYADFLVEHAVDPDKRRYAVKNEAPKHYIDMDRFGSYPFDSIPRRWTDAVEKYSTDTLSKHGIVPWWIQVMLARLTAAFRQKDKGAILKLSAELAHYIADAHVPLHTSSNHNGQHTGQKGIHGFWESRIPELLAENEWDFFIGKASYIGNPLDFTWKRVLESAAAADSVLKFEKALSSAFPPDQKYAFENRNGQVIRQYSSAYTREYDRLMNGMVERRMRQSIKAVASFWYTAWVNAGQPNLAPIAAKPFSPQDLVAFEKLNADWREAGSGEEH